MGKIGVLVVDDSAFMRKLISDFLNQEEGIEVVGTARNGQDAIKKVQLLKPDVVTMDIEMPVMNGLEALQVIMEQFPRPVIMLSSMTKEGAKNTIKSLQYGAVDFIAKPSGAISIDLHKIKAEMIEKVTLAKLANVHKLSNEVNSEKSPDNKLDYSKIDSNENKRPRFVDDIHRNQKIVCIGTSTGGPRALQQVLTKLPATIDAPIFIVQHMPPGFTKSLAKRLNSVSMITVKEAENNELAQNGVAYIAPGGFHLKIKKYGVSLKINIDQSAVRNGHRPSVDVLFESISELQGYLKIAVIMTGMGSDGTEGLKSLKLTGAVKAISESEKTAIVFGMPKSAINTQLIDRVEDVEDIGDTIMKYVRNPLY